MTLTLGDRVRIDIPDELELVLGWSMGAQQTYEWAVRYPEMVKRAAPIGGTARNSPQSSLLVDTLISALKLDPNWNEGYYDDHRSMRQGLRQHARTWVLMGTSADLWREEEWRGAGFSSLNDFMHRLWDEWFLPMDPNNLIEWPGNGNMPM